MKKYIIAKTGQPVNIGDTLQGTKDVNTSFGKMKIVEEFLLTEDNFQDFIDIGVIKVVSQRRAVKNQYDLGKIITLLADRYGKSSEEVTEWLENTNAICPKAVLDILLQEIAIRFYNDDPNAFDEAKEYYSLRPKDGKVGKVSNINSYMPLFKSVEDAEKAREILKEQLNRMYGQADC